MPDSKRFTKKDVRIIQALARYGVIEYDCIRKVFFEGTRRSVSDHRVRWFWKLGLVRYRRVKSLNPIIRLNKRRSQWISQITKSRPEFIKSVGDLSSRKNLEGLTLSSRIGLLIEKLGFSIQVVSRPEILIKGFHFKVKRKRSDFRKHSPDLLLVDKENSLLRNIFIELEMMAHSKPRTRSLLRSYLEDPRAVRVLYLCGSDHIYNLVMTQMEEILNAMGPIKKRDRASKVVVGDYEEFRKHPLECQLMSFSGPVRFSELVRDLEECGERGAD